MTLKDKAMNAIKNLFTSEELVQLQSELAAAVTPPKEEEVKMEAKELMTLDGKKLSLEGSLAVDSKLFEVTEGGNVPAEGTYETAEGTIVSVAGVITEVKPIEEAPAEMTEKPKEEEVKMSAEHESLTKEIEKLKESNKLLLSFMDRLINTPVQLSEQKKAKRYEDMTPAEKYNHDHPIN